MYPVIAPVNHETINWTRFLLAAVVMAIGIWGGLETFVRGYRKSLPKVESSPEPTVVASDDWTALCERAEAIVAKTIAELPAQVAGEAAQVACLFRERDENPAEGYRTLGRYHNFFPGKKSDYKGPIVLYLRTIEEICAETGDDFEAEVKTTYLHELGHHLGWDEVDLARQGLPSGRPPGG